MTIDVLDNLAVRMDAAVTFGRRNAVPLAASLFNMMNTRDPLILTQWSSGDYAPMTGGSTNILPVTEGAGGEKRVDNLKLNAALSVSWSPWKFLTLEGKAAPRFNVSHTHQFDDVIRYASDAFGTQSPVTSRLYNELTESQTQNFYMTWQFTAAFHKEGGGFLYDLHNGTNRNPPPFKEWRSCELQKPPAALYHKGMPDAGRAETQRRKYLCSKK